MGLKIWKPTCPSCGKGLKLRKGQIDATCEFCDSYLIIEGWEPGTKPLRTSRGFPTGTFVYHEDPPHATCHEYNDLDDPPSLIYNY